MVYVILYLVDTQMSWSFFKSFNQWQHKAEIVLNITVLQNEKWSKFIHNLQDEEYPLYCQ